MSDIAKIPGSETPEIDHYAQFRASLGINVLVGLPKREGWIRKGVIVNYPGSAGPELALNFDRHVQAGYTLVLSTESIIDDRHNGPNTLSRPNRVPAPITGLTAEGFKYVVMEIACDKECEYYKAQEEKTQKQNIDNFNGTTTKAGQELRLKENDTVFNKYGAKD